MLSIYLGNMPEAIYNTAVYFKNDYEDEWILDPLVIEYTSTNERTSGDSPEPEPESGQETEQEQETSEYSWIKDLSIFKH